MNPFKKLTAWHAIVSGVVLYLSNLFAAYVLDWYGMWPHLDIPMHFLGGFIVGMLGIALHHGLTNKQHLKGTPWWYHLLFVASFTVMVAVVWEFHEFVVDQTFTIWYNLPASQISIRDTMMDLLMGLLGGVGSFFTFKKQL